MSHVLPRHDRWRRVKYEADPDSNGLIDQIQIAEFELDVTRCRFLRRHIGHVGWDPNTGFDVGATPTFMKQQCLETTPLSS